MFNPKLTTIFNCISCFYSSRNEKLIKKHNLKGNHFYFKCDWCKEHFQTANLTREHQKERHKNKNIRILTFRSISYKNSEIFCNLCSNEIKTTDIEKHNRDKHNLKNDKRNIYIKSNILARTNQNCNTNEVYLYRCQYCEAYFNSLFELKGHSIIVHKIENADVRGCIHSGNGVLLDDAKLPRYVCAFCSSEYFTFLEVKRHFKSHKFKIKPFKYIFYSLDDSKPKIIEEPTYKCTKCEKVPDNLSALKKHWEKYHNGHDFKVEKLIDCPSKESYSCNVCNFICNNNVLFNLHMKLSHNMSDAHKCFSDTFHKSDKKTQIVPQKPIHSTKNKIFKEDSILCSNAKSVTNDQMNILQNQENKKCKEKINGMPLTLTGKDILAASKIETLAKLYRCFHCSKEFEIFSALSNHFSNNHSLKMQKKLYLYIFKCGKKIEIVFSLDKLYQCIYCDGINKMYTIDFNQLCFHYKEKHKSITAFKYYLSEGKDGFISHKLQTYFQSKKSNSSKKAKVQSADSAPKESLQTLDKSTKMISSQSQNEEDSAPKESHKTLCKSTKNISSQSQNEEDSALKESHQTLCKSTKIISSQSHNEENISFRKKPETITQLAKDNSLRTSSNTLPILTGNSQPIINKSKALLLPKGAIQENEPKSNFLSSEPLPNTSEKCYLKDDRILSFNSPKEIEFIKEISLVDLNTLEKECSSSSLSHEGATILSIDSKISQDQIPLNQASQSVTPTKAKALLKQTTRRGLHHSSLANTFPLPLPSLNIINIEESPEIELIASTSPKAIQNALLLNDSHGWPLKNDCRDISPQVEVMNEVQILAKEATQSKIVQQPLSNTSKMSAYNLMNAQIKTPDPQKGNDSLISTNSDRSVLSGHSFRIGDTNNVVANKEHPFQENDDIEIIGMKMNHKAKSPHNLESRQPSPSTQCILDPSFIPPLIYSMHNQQTLLPHHASETNFDLNQETPILKSLRSMFPGTSNTEALKQTACTGSNELLRLLLINTNSGTSNTESLKQTACANNSEHLHLLTTNTNSGTNNQGSTKEQTGESTGKKIRIKHTKRKAPHDPLEEASKMPKMDAPSIEQLDNDLMVIEEIPSQIPPEGSVPIIKYEIDNPKEGKEDQNLDDEMKFYLSDGEEKTIYDLALSQVKEEKKVGFSFYGSKPETFDLDSLYLVGEFEGNDIRVSLKNVFLMINYHPLVYLPKMESKSND